MKKILYVLMLLFPIAASSQITVTSSDMPVVNDTIRVSIINGPDTINPQLADSNYTWNYSFLQPDEQKVDSFVNTLSTDPAYYFYFNNFFDQTHYASYATPIAPPPSFNSNFQVSDVYYYYKKSSAEYSQVGFGAKLNGIPMSQKYDPVDVIYEFPLNYGNTSTSTSSFAYSFPNNDYYGRTTVRNNTVDGWGTLTTPYGTFQTLRVKSVLDITDTLYLDTLQQGFTIPRPTQYEYKWLSNGKKIPLLEIDAQKGFGNSIVINQIIYRDSVRIDITNGENTIVENFNLSLYPNPTSGKFSVQIQDARYKMQDTRYKMQDTGLPAERQFGLQAGYRMQDGAIEIYNVLGERVYYSLTFSERSRTIDLSNEPSGIYFLKIQSGENNFTSKIILEK